ncbi:hypothetical protein JAAARDRAFT_29299 [Jaapia argillacea MUCL 33604]|uniref:WHIM1 domain-containing protein n=1 Tax=Jaapia argillacea MUCL 33604 TaxID=933084 RepID=A0A067QIC8_9AGAM|nr:hypothetical protein JAAARDRAFT_29299 [Jaapia argillacea MUCL 33604]
MKPDTVVSEKKGHVCPPSNATHPSNRWESLFVYSFICKFTNLRGHVEGLQSPMDFEAALLSKEPNPIITEVLARFIRNLRPQTRNVSTDQISSTVASVMADYMKASERTIFWDEDLKVNVDPFQGLEGGFFTADWDIKLKILRQLVELQLSHAPEIKGIIDRAWGVVHNKHKKQDKPAAAPEPAESANQEKLQMIPIGQDIARKRYWIADDSPRLYLSTNPWKITATFQTISSSREQYVAIIERLKAEAPVEGKGGEKKPKLEQAHLALVKALEGRLEAIDAELARVAKARRKIEQKQLFNVQAEIRQTRLRRVTRRPDYAYLENGGDDEDGFDEYQHREEPDDDDYRDQVEEERFSLSRSATPSGSGSRRPSAGPDRRRSTRTAVVNANGKRAAPDEKLNHWRGERRSTRLGAPPEMQLDEPVIKRARTEESSASASSASVEPAPATNGLKIKISGAAALKPTETALEQVAGKKKSKFWFYAVEHIAGAATSQQPLQPSSSNQPGPSHPNSNGYSNGGAHMTTNGRNGNGNGGEKAPEGSLSPASSPSWDG